MAKAKRVFQLAKELGVSSKDILAKCQAEGLDNMTNHMSTVSIGLEQTINEWFSDEQADSPEESHTAVEVAEKVDVTKAKAKARKRAKPKPEPEVEVTTEAAEPEEAAAAPKAAAKKKPKVEEEAAPVADVAAPVEAEPVAEEAPSEPVEMVAEAPTEAAEPEAEAAEQTPGSPVAQPNVPQRPDVVKPAGPQLEAPKAAKLKGPKLIRQEQPDHVPQLRPKRPQGDRGGGGPRGPGGGGASGGAGGGGSDGFIRSQGPVRGRGAGGGGAVPREDDRKRRSRSSRRGRSADAELFSGGRHSISEQDMLERQERLNRSGGYLKRRRRDMSRRASGGGGQTEMPVDVGGKVEIAEPFTIKDLSAATGIKGAEVVGYLFKNKGMMVTINQAIGVELAQEVCMEYDIELVVKEAQTAEQKVEKQIEDRDRTDIRRRPPVVAVLGHVDHGKTSLLDKIRAEDVAAGEAGGITQHIGAYRATIKGSDGADKTVVFLDTPGHEAFTTMRARGANLTDVVVLVIAADDGVMPQTIESISHAKAAGVPIVVALNKIDVPQATDENVTRILGQLAEHELNPVEWGGETEVIRTSAETGQGVTELMEMLDYQAELLELTADYGGKAYGQVIEAELSEGRGPVGRVLLREGQLAIGDFIVVGRAFGRVRDMIDDRGKPIEQAGPATPLEISGIDEVPDAGDKFYITQSLKQAEQIAQDRRDLERKAELASKTKVTLDNVFEQMKTSDVKELKVVLKADVQGSVEVLRKSLAEVAADNEEVTVTVLHGAVGGITESDVLLAEASDAVIVGFQVIASQRARAEAERRNVDMRLYRVIYDIVDDVKAALEGMLAPERREEVVGHAEVREVFRVSKVGMVAGCYVTDGQIERNAMIRVTRDNIVIEHDRVLQQLKRFKDDAKEVRSGMECGMSIEGYDDIRAGDVLECYRSTEVAKKL